MEKLKVIKVADEKSGTSKDGKAWNVVSLLTETTDQYPRKVVVDFWGESAKTAKRFEEGLLILVELRPESREYNGKYYTSIRAGKVEIEGAAQNRAANAAESVTKSFTEPIDNQSNDLPF